MNDPKVVELHDAHVQAYNDNRAISRELASDIMRLAMKVSKPNYSVFASWSPHVSAVHVDIHNEGWKSDHRAEQSYTVYLDHEEAHDKLRAIQDLIVKWDPANQ